MRERRHVAAGTALGIVLAFGISACTTRSENSSPPVNQTPTPSPAPGPQSFYDITDCLTQTVPNMGGQTVAQTIIPDTVTINYALPQGFPNGRHPVDPVIDITLAMIFLDLDAPGQNLHTVADVPLNPDETQDRDAERLRTSFPWLGPPRGSPPLSGTNGTSFNFRTESPDDPGYVKVERMGAPAVGTALISSEIDVAYNEGTPAEDLEGEFRLELVEELEILTDDLGDDLIDLGLTLCASPRA